MRFALLVVLAVAAVHAETVAILGDSLTAGYGLDEQQAYPALIQHELKTLAPQWNVVNAGVSGDTTAGGRRRIGWLLKSKPEVVLIALGGNDGLRGMPVTETIANLTAMIDAIRAAGATPLLAGMQLPTNYGDDYRTAFARAFPAVAESTKTALLPFLLDGVAADRSLNQADGIHPNAEGQRRVAKLVLAFLKPHLGLPLEKAVEPPSRQNVKEKQP